MHAEKLILETDSNGNFTHPPVLPPNAKIEAIFLVLNKTQPRQHREPSAKIAGKGKILGDIITPVLALPANYHNTTKTQPTD